MQFEKKNIKASISFIAGIITFFAFISGRQKITDLWEESTVEKIYSLIINYQSLIENEKLLKKPEQSTSKSVDYEKLNLEVEMVQEPKKFLLDTIPVNYDYRPVSEKEKDELNNKIK
jgi:hypothetical protein